MRFIVSPRMTAKESMLFDEQLFLSAEAGVSDQILRVYSWKKPSITLGYSQDINAEINRDKCLEFGIDAVKRPTGGGIVFHNLSEVSVSMLINRPKHCFDLFYASKIMSEILNKTMESFSINSSVLCRDGEGDVKFCFSYPSRFEIKVSGRKIAGIAQRSGRKSFLVQSSIFVCKDTGKMLSCLNKKFSEKDYNSKATCINEQIGRIPLFAEIAEAVKANLPAF